MSDDLVIYQNDKNFDVQLTVYKKDGKTPKVLTGFTINFKMWDIGVPATPLVDVECSATDAVNGVYEFTAPDKFPTDKHYYYEIELTKTLTGERSSSDHGIVRVKESA